MPPHALNYPWPWGASAFLTSRSCSIGSDHRGVWIPSGRNRFAERAGAGTSLKPCARGWADRNVSWEATSLWFYTTTLTSRQGIFLQKVVHSMEKGLLLQEIMKRKSWKIRINCCENHNILKKFFIWVVLEFFGCFVLFYEHCNSQRCYCSLWMWVFYFKTFFFLIWETSPSGRKWRNPRGQWGKQIWTENQMKNETENEQMKRTKDLELNPAPQWSRTFTLPSKTGEMSRQSKC